MHARNRYKHAPLSFEKLAEKHVALKPFLTSTEGAGFDSKQPGAVEELVKAMLCVDFRIKSYVGVPEGYLVPSVTRSLNYLHFMEDLLREAEDKNVILRNAPRRGLDVGVGASCIFPLLGCAMHPDWTFCGVDVDEGALQSARTNAEQFSTRIEIKHSDMLHDVDGKFDFMLCNPPFFSSPVSNPGEYRPFGGRELERNCEGGEVQFVSTLIDQSVLKQNEIVWFSSMLGIKESLQQVLEKLHHLRPSLVETIRVYRLEQGHTFRWVVAWSFHKALLGTATLLGRELFVGNLKENETLESRSNEALRMLRNYSLDTGICGSRQLGFRFRLRVVLFPSTSKFRVDVLDLVDHEQDGSGAAAAKAARSAQNRVEQDITRTSRKWKKKTS